jgi:hypothetical protein
MFFPQISLLGSGGAAFGHSAFLWIEPPGSARNRKLRRKRCAADFHRWRLDSQRSLFQAELTLAQARNNEYQSLVQLYKALGGGWK